MHVDIVRVSTLFCDQGLTDSFQRVGKDALKKLDAKDVLLIFPQESKRNKTVRVLKTQKTESSVRKIFLPRSVAEMLMEWRKQQFENMKILGDEFQNYNLEFAHAIC